MPETIWLNEFKIAVLNEDEESIERLIQNAPLIFDSIEELEEVATLTKDAEEIIQKRLEKLSLELKKLKDARNYIWQ
ncbi:MULTISPECIES: hypothetical protein [unclassified Campylobacter]|uniref:hypothetical protein n=1 Tax=unclassified Campylobacter TaxID=2593542 RepID=UPI0014733C6E|nr:MULTISPECIES: hypothetical protein [unclassified Campylobacter]